MNSDTCDTNILYEGVKKRIYIYAHYARTRYIYKIPPLCGESEHFCHYVSQVSLDWRNFAKNAVFDVTLDLVSHYPIKCLYCTQ